jgi:hypothetical protein
MEHGPVENLILLLIALFVPFALVLCYMTPAATAFSRRHPQKDTIRAVNLFFGWTVIGWLVALIWSFSAGDRSATATAGFVRAAEPRLTAVPDAINEIHAEVLGLSERNKDGIDRERLVRRLLPGQDLLLVRDHESDVPGEAVKVCLPDGRQFGVLDPDLGARVAMNLDANRKIDCRVLAVSGANGRGYRVEVVLVIHVLRKTPTSHPMTSPRRRAATGA